MVVPMVNITITATFVDFIGHRLNTTIFNASWIHNFRRLKAYRSQSIPNQNFPTERTTTVAEGFSQIVVTFENVQEGLVSGIDFVNTGCYLYQSVWRKYLR